MVKDFFKLTNLRMEKKAIASIIAFDSKPGDTASGCVFLKYLQTAARGRVQATRTAAAT
jgi:hypothetical protein